MNGESRPPAPEGMPPSPEGAPPAPPPFPDPQSFPGPLARPQVSFSTYRRGQRFPMVPMGVGELIDAAVNLYRVHWKTLMGIVAFVMVPFAFVQSFVLSRAGGGVFTGFDPTSTTEPTPKDVSALLLAVLFSAVQGLLLQPFLTAAIARAVADAYLGTEATVGSTYRYAVGRFHSILWVTFLAGIASLGGLLLLIVPGVIFYVRLLFGPAVVVVEGTKGTSALGRSWRLARGRFWKLFGVLLLTYLLITAVGGTLAFGVAALSGLAGPVGWVLDAAAASAVEIVSRPLLTIIIVLLYFDLRIRKEGLDLALMAQELGAVG